MDQYINQLWLEVGETQRGVNDVDWAVFGVAKNRERKKLCLVNSRLVKMR